MYLRALSGSKFHSVTSSNVILYNDVKHSIFIKTSRWCKKALTTSQRLQMSFVEIGDEHIFKLKIQKGT